MDAQRLARHLEQAETHRKVVGDYRGAYSLGVTAHPSGSGAALLLRIGDSAAPGVPRSVKIDDEDVPVIVQGGFKPPTPL